VGRWGVRWMGFGPMSVRPAVRGFVAMACVACWGFGQQGSASAAAGQFGSEGEGAGQFVDPAGVAVDQSDGAVFLADRLNARAEGWSGEGVFASAWGWGVGRADASPESAELESCSAVCFAGVPGSGAGQFGDLPSGVAVDNSLGFSHGDVYVADPANLRVQKFSPSGDFLLMFGKGVNEKTGGDVCAAAEAAFCGAGGEEPGPGGFDVLGGNVVAVDSVGDVLVGGRERVERFSSGGEFESEISLPGLGVVESLAIDSTGNLYVTASGVFGVHKFDQGGTELGEPRDPEAESSNTVIAIGPADELFVYDNEQGHVQTYAAAGGQTESFVEEGSSRGIAYSDVTDALYVLHHDHVSVASPPPPGPVVLTGSERVDEVLPTSVTAHAIVNPEGPEATMYHFEYGPTEAYGSSTEPVELGGGAFEDQPVGATLSGLAPSTEYHFRVVVTNTGGQATTGPDETFTTAAAVSVEDESVSEVAGSSARLEAVLNPHGLASEYQFEYGETLSYGHLAPASPAELAGETTGVRVSVLVEGLAPATTYHFRVVAHNALGSAHGADQTFVTQAAGTAGLTDGRAWEMVSPSNKHSGTLETMSDNGALIEAAEGGGAITYVANGTITAEAEGSRSNANTQLLATRAATGWTTKDISTPREEVVGLTPGAPSEYLMFSNDLSVGAVEPFGSTPLAPELMGEHGERTPYLRQPDGAYTPLVTASNTPPGTKFGGEELKPDSFSGGVSFITMTPDGATALLGSEQPLTSGVSGSGYEGLYEWHEGRLTPVSVLPDNRPSSEEGLNARLGASDLQVRGAMSRDASRVVFMTEGESGTQQHLYLHDVLRDESVQLDVPASGVRANPGRPLFQIATPDASRVFFTDDARLTVDATAKPGEPDLYACDVAVVAGKLSCSLTNLTVDANRNEAASVLGDVIGIDNAGRYVYFVANGALAPGAEHGSCVERSEPYEASSATTCNLYVRDLGSGVTSLVGVLSNRDDPDWGGGGTGPLNLGELSARVSDNGRFLAFMSARPLTGFDNRDANSGERDVEVFLFDRAEKSLRCVSCDSSGARPKGVLDPLNPPPFLLMDGPSTWKGLWLAALIPTWTKTHLFSALYQSRFLSDSGRLFFDSAVGLVSGDGNGRSDVYEYEPDGIGGCGLGAGCVALMSSGTSGQESAFLDASGSGDDVFFMTSAQLASQDVDGALDVYDAHVCSAAVPCPAGVVAATPACSTSDSCRVAPAPQPDVFGAPATETYSGAGNPVSVSVRGHHLSRAQKLARALRACKRKPKHLRAACRRRAKRRYGPVHRSHGSRTAARRGGVTGRSG
jgi:hypothetical protein